MNTVINGTRKYTNTNKCVCLRYSDLVGCHGNSHSGDCGCPMFLSNVCCQTQAQENCHLCPTSSAPLTVPSDSVLAAENHVALILFSVDQQTSRSTSSKIAQVEHNHKCFTWLQILYLDQGHILVTQCLLLTIWGRNLAGVTRSLSGYQIQPLICLTSRRVTHLCTDCLFFWKIDLE